jgi:hypoxanthine phosphoribosyltransferase
LTRAYVIDEMISAKSIAARIEALSREIQTAFAGTDKLVVVGLLRGSFVFIADLVRELDLPVEVDFLEASSYGDSMESSREVRILKDLRGEIDGRDVLLVEDIVDTGFTLSHVVALLKTREPARLETIALLDKPTRREVEIRADLDGFSRFPTNSSWATASTSRSATATCPSSARCASPDAGKRGRVAREARGDGARAECAGAARRPDRRGSPPRPGPTAPAGLRGAARAGRGVAQDAGQDRAAKPGLGHRPQDGEAVRAARDRRTWPASASHCPATVPASAPRRPIHAVAPGAP